MAFGLVEQGTPKRELETRVADALRRVNLDGLDKRMPGQLSGGQQQRVVLARALVLNPRVVLLDEPLSNLDAKLRLEMREEIQRLHRDMRITFVYVTHDQAEALSLADRLAVMNAGRLVAVGAPRDLYHRPPDRFCAEFLGEANLVPGRIVDLQGDRVKVETALGVWQGVPAPGAAFRRGAAALCMVRPENLRPGRGADDSNPFTASVRVARMNGSTLTVMVEAGGLSLKATLLNEFNLPLNVGAQAALSVTPENVVVLPADGEGRA